MEQGQQDILEGVFNPRKLESWSRSGADMRLTRQGSGVDVHMCALAVGCCVLVSARLRAPVCL